MYAAYLYNKDASPAFGTPQFPVWLSQEVGEREEKFLSRVFDMAKHLTQRGKAKGKYRVKLERIA